MIRTDLAVQENIGPTVVISSHKIAGVTFEHHEDITRCRHHPRVIAAAVARGPIGVGRNADECSVDHVA